jgi:hypothetical protein
VDYAEVLKRTWQITWHRKGFWILGLLAGCSASGRGGGGGSSQAASGTNFSFDQRSFGFERSYPELERFFTGIPGETWIAFGLALFCLAIAAFLIFFFIGVLGQAGLIAGFSASDEGEAVSLSQAFKLGWEHYWTLVGIRIVFAVASFLIIGAFLIFYLVAGIATFGIGLICLLPLLCALVPLALAADVFSVLSMVAAVEEELGVFDAFRRAWNVIKENAGPVIVMGLILVIGGAVLGFILALPLTAVAVPLIAGLILQSEQALFTGIAISAICFVVALPVFILVNSVLTTFITGAWTTTYRRLIGKSGAKEIALS